MPIARTTLLLVLMAARATAAAAGCQTAAVGPCVIELHGKGAPRLTRSCTEDVWRSHLAFELPDRFSDADGNGWHEAVVRIDVDPRGGCGCAVFRITYEGQPAGFSVNIGDSPTNDGYGGDDWSTRFDAELHIHGRDLTAFGAERPGAPADQQIFGMRALPLADAVLELEVCDQSVRFVVETKGKEPPLTGFFNSYHSRELISIRSSAEAGDPKADRPDSRIYAAFNRVIHRRSGRPAQDRFGSGVRRVEIALIP